MERYPLLEISSLHSRLTTRLMASKGMHRNSFGQGMERQAGCFFAGKIGVRVDLLDF